MFFYWAKLMVPLQTSFGVAAEVNATLAKQRATKAPAAPSPAASSAPAAHVGKDSAAAQRDCESCVAMGHGWDARTGECGDFANRCFAHPR